MVDNTDLPLGFSMALAQNQEAMNVFTNLDESQKQKVIDGTHSISSRNEMHQYVMELGRRFTIR